MSRICLGRCGTIHLTLLSIRNLKIDLAGKTFLGQKAKITEKEGRKEDILIQQRMIVLHKPRKMPMASFRILKELEFFPKLKVLLEDIHRIQLDVPEITLR